MNRRTSIKSLAIGLVAPRFFLKPLSPEDVSLAKELISNEVDHNERLSFTNPAKYWNSQSLHIGNGFLGLSFLGGVQEEIIAITEKTLWTGGPGEDPNYNYGIKPGGSDYLTKIRQHILSNEIDQLKLADQLVKEHFLGDSKAYGYFSSFGRLSVFFDHASVNYKNYSRELDISSALANVQYEVNDVTFKREYFCSYPDRVAVLKFSASKEGNLSFKLKWKAFQRQNQLSYENHIYMLSGKINGNNRQFCLKMHVEASGGKVYLMGDELVIENATTVNILLAAATEYTAEAPLYNGADPYKITAQQIKVALNYTVKEIKKRHIADYQHLYKRVRLTVPGNAIAESFSTGTRWENYGLAKYPDPGLKVLYFNLSRYLLISSSRPGSLPANLQGNWNMFEAAQWSGNYQSNINVQLNYSSAGAVNLLECQEPYNNWIKGLVKPGTDVAKAYYKTDGWVSHAIGNIWGYTAPGFELGWGMYPAGAAWHCHFIWAHFRYSQDETYLRKTGYPLMRGAALFWLQNLVDYKGYLISAPSGSAEHGVFIKNGQLLTTGSSFDEDIINVPCNFQDIEMISELFANTMKAAAVLNIDEAFAASLRQSKDKLMPLKIGRYGQLQEWDEDVDSPECNHRHIGHLYALWPANEINIGTKKLAAAAKKTLEMRGDERNYKGSPHKDVYTAANWSLGLRMACWLRLHEAERANQLFTQIITKAGFENLMTYQHVPQSEKAVKNQPDVEFFSTTEGYWYPVWQIDTSLAIAGLIAEMLIQVDSDGVITLLPALPSEWPDGKIQGLKADGNLTIDLEWRKTKLIKYRIYSKDGRKVKLIVDNVLREVSTLQIHNINYRLSEFYNERRFDGQH